MVPCVQTFSQQLHGYTRQLRANFREAQLRHEPLREFKIITAYRRNKNLKDLLVHTALTKKRSGGDPWLLQSVPYLFGGGSGRGYPIKQQLSAQTPNIIYAIQCQRCKKLYIGETGRSIRVRIKEHINSIKKGQTDTILYTNFTSCGLQQWFSKWGPGPPGGPPGGTRGASGNQRKDDQKKQKYKN